MGMKGRIAVMVVTLLFGLFGCAKKSDISVTSVEAMTLTLNGMRGSFVYEIANEGDKTELRYYRKVYAQGEDILELEKSAVCDTQELIDLMNTCSIIKWDGFHGKHPKNVQDGIMFVFSADINGGQTVHAEGSANFPKKYNEFVRALNTILSESEKN